MSNTTHIRVFAAASEHWAERLLCEISWDGATLVVQGEKAIDVQEINNLVGQLHHAQQGFPVHGRAADGTLLRNAQGKITRVGFRGRATHSPAEVLDALAENLELRRVYRIERI